MIGDEVGRFTITSGSFDTLQFGGKVTLELYPRSAEDLQKMAMAIGNGDWRQVYSLVHVGDVEPLRPVPQAVPLTKVDSPAERELTLRALYGRDDAS